MPQFSDDLFLGPIVPGNSYASGSDNPSPMTTGVGPLGRIYVWDTVPLTLQAAGLVAGQTSASTAGTLTLAAGTGVTTSTAADGTVSYVLDVPRCVTTASGTADNTAMTIVITGKDQYGQAMSQSIAGATATATVATTKAFKSVSSVTWSGRAITGSNLTIGFNDTIGAPFKIAAKEYVAQANYNSTQVALTVVTAAATTTNVTSGDVRGTVALPAAADGAKRLVMALLLPALAVGPSATRAGALGLSQNLV